MKEALEVVYKHNMCTYYLLPLIGVNKFSFGIELNFRNCYANTEGTELYVSVNYSLSSLENHPNLLRVAGQARSPIYVFDLPKKWAADFELFKQGKYSKFSKEAKERIIEGSGLRYRALNPIGNPTTDIRLLAIESEQDRRDILRTKLIEFYGVTIDHDAELISPPSESSFKTFNSLMAS